MLGFKNPISTVVSLLFLGGALLYFMTNATVLWHAGSMTKAMNEAANPKDPFKNSNITITGNRLSNSRQFQPGYKEMANFGDIDVRRTVTFNTSVRMQSLLESGEAMPERGMEKIFAKTAAIRYAQKECQRVLATLAKECVVDHADGRVQDDLVKISASLRFVQKGEFGTLTENSSYAFASVNQILVQDERTHYSALERNRTDLYKQALRECESIKRREGNCAVTSLNIVSSTSRGYETIHAQARYSYLSKI